MSDAPAPADAASEPLWTPQTIIALIGLAIVGGTVIGVFLKGDAPTLQLVVGIVLGSFGSSVFGFYFQSSQGSQKKDATIAAQLASDRVVAPLVPRATSSVSSAPITTTIVEASVAAPGTAANTAAMVQNTEATQENTDALTQGVKP